MTKRTGLPAFACLLLAESRRPVRHPEGALPQAILDPQLIPGNVASCRAPDVLPQAVREFGHLPDVARLWPGDLILVCPVAGGRVAKGIQSFQRLGGFSEEHARWHHAAVFLGTGFDIVEAGMGTLDVSIGSLLEYLPGHIVRVRRPSGGTRELGWMLAVNAMRLLGRPYSLATILKLAARATRGFWKPRASLGQAHHRALICSQVFSDAFAATHMRVAADPAIPAKLSASEALEDVGVAWRRVA